MLTQLLLTARFWKWQSLSVAIMGRLESVATALSGLKEQTIGRACPKQR